MSGQQLSLIFFCGESMEALMQVGFHLEPTVCSLLVDICQFGSFTLLNAICTIKRSLNEYLLAIHVLSRAVDRDYEITLSLH